MRKVRVSSGNTKKDRAVRAEPLVEGVKNQFHDSCERSSLDGIRKPAGYWQVWSNFEAEARRIIGRNEGLLPAYGELTKQGHTSFVAAARKYYGGLPKVRERLGLKKLTTLHRTGEKSYRIWENLRTELEALIAEHGNIPSCTKLWKMGRSDIIGGIKIHGGFFEVRKKMRLKQKRKKVHRRKKDETLTKWKNIEPMLRKILEENEGEIPGELVLREQGYACVAIAITRHHDGMTAIRKRLGLNIRRREGNMSLKNWENLEKIIRKIVAECGYLPHSDDLRKMGYAAVAVAISRKHGGFGKVREKIKELGIVENKEFRKWYGMMDNELLEYAIDYLKQEDITTRTRLCKVRSGLYDALKRRELLDKVFAEIDAQRKASEDGQAAEDMFSAVGKM